MTSKSLKGQKAAPKKPISERIADYRRSLAEANDNRMREQKPAQTSADRAALRRQVGLIVTAAERREHDSKVKALTEHPRVKSGSVKIDLDTAVRLGVTPDLIATDADLARIDQMLLHHHRVPPHKRPPPIRPELAAIAVEHLGERFAVLEARGSDSLDFHDASVVGVREALEAAFELGRRTPAQYRALSELVELLEEGTTADGVLSVAPAPRVAELVKLVRS